MVDLSFLTLRNLLLWFAAWTVIGILLMGEDKDQSVAQRDLSHAERISERTLHEVALLGGFLGIIVGAELFHHKVSKPSFWPPVLVAIPIWVVVVYYALFGRLPNINL